MQCIPKSITKDHNNGLTSIPSKEEITKVVFSFEGDKAPSPDGFPFLFFQNYWHIIQEDASNGVKGAAILPRVGGKSRPLKPLPPEKISLFNGKQETKKVTKLMVVSLFGGTGKCLVFFYSFKDARRKKSML